MEALARISGKGGSDILAAGTYKRSDGTLKSPIYAFEYSSADITLTVVKDEYDGLLSSKLVYLDVGNEVAITQDMGVMVFPTAVSEFVSSAQLKVWYV